MAKRTKKPRKVDQPTDTNNEIPPGATRKALDRPLDPGGGPPGSAGGPRHAVDDVGSENETVEAVDITRTAASPPEEEEDQLAKGPPFAGRSGGAVGGTPAQMRSAEHFGSREIVVSDPDATTSPMEDPNRIVTPSEDKEGILRLIGYDAIEYAEKHSLPLNKHPDSISGPRTGLSIAEAEAIADEDAELIWLDVNEEDYYTGPPVSFEPEY